MPVYHLVIDAVELYNETWEEEYIKSSQLDEKHDEMLSATSAVTVSEPSAAAVGEVEGVINSSASAGDGRQNTKAKRLNYMSAVNQFSSFFFFFTSI